MAQLVRYSTIPNLTEATATTMWHDLRKKIEGAGAGAGSVSTDDHTTAVAAPVGTANSYGIDSNDGRHAGTEDDRDEEDMDMEESAPLVPVSLAGTPAITAAPTIAPAATPDTTPAITAPTPTLPAATPTPTAPTTTTLPATTPTTPLPNSINTPTTKIAKKPGFSAAMAKAKVAKKARKQEITARASAFRARASTNETKEEGTKKERNGVHEGE